MKITEKSLDASLNKSLHNIYIILSNESIQIEETQNKIYKVAKQNNFLQKETHIVEPNTDWDFLNRNSDNLDLFGSRKIIEIKLLGQGPGVKGANALKEFSKESDPNILLMVIGENLEKKVQSSAWLSALEGSGILISIPKLSSKSLKNWIKHKGKQLDIDITKEAVQILTEKTEGNLMAALKEIEKLSLVYPSEKIDEDRMKKNITDSSKFGIFDFSNAFISRDTKKAIHILESLKAEGTPESLIIWALNRELNNLFKVNKSGSTKGVWGPTSYLNSLQKTSKDINSKDILNAYKSIALIDASIKGFDKQNPWLSIRELTLNF
tara:strand:+ start:99 stop:1070 length:972 start_codon:yes stop_codon:yes gene_type:complete